MKPAAWRFVLLSLCAIVAFLAVASVLSLLGFGGAAPWTGFFKTSGTAAPFGVRLVAVAPNGPGARAGIRAGDVIDSRQNSLLERYFFVYHPLNGRPIRILLHRGTQDVRVTVVPRSLTEILNGDLRSLWSIQSSNIVVPALTLWLTFFAGIIAWRRSSSPEMRTLALALILYGLAPPATGVTWATPWARPYVVFDFSADIALPLAIGLWIALAGAFGQPLSTTRRALQLICYIAIAIWIGLGIASSIGLITVWYDWNAPIFTSPYLAYGITAGALLCTLLAVLASHGAERQRSLWVLAPLGALVLVKSLSAVLPSFLVNVFVSYGTAVFVTWLQVVIAFLAPAALTYAALSRRFIDIGFVLNRSLVFLFVSAIVVVTFIAVEWAASTWFTGMTHTSSTIIGLFVALFLGLSLRPIHAGVDHFVDRVFFRKRHEDEAALRRFAEEAAYITDRSVLLSRAAVVVCERTGAQEAYVALPDGAGSYASPAGSNGERAVSENDPGILALKAWHKPIDVHSLGNSAIRGDVAFPMVARGVLVGVLVCGPKRDGEVYAPDESQALAALAHGVGAALGTLVRQPADPFARLHEAIVSMQESILAELRAPSEDAT